MSPTELSKLSMFDGIFIETSEEQEAKQLPEMFFKGEFGKTMLVAEVHL